MKRNIESDYQRTFLGIASKTIPFYRFFRRNVGLVKLGSSPRVFRAGIPGQCDLYVLGRGGWHGEIEIKRFGALTDEQIIWRDWCRDWEIPWLLLQADKEEAPSITISRWVVEVREWLRVSVKS